MLSYILFLLFAALHTCRAIPEELTFSNFFDKLGNSENNVVYFYSPWYRSMKKMMPIYKFLESEFTSSTRTQNRMDDVTKLKTTKFFIVDGKKLLLELLLDCWTLLLLLLLDLIHIFQTIFFSRSLPTCKI